jgi:hypothetical protein
VQAVERSGTLGNQVLASFGKQAQHFRFGLGIDPDHSTFMLRTHLRFGRISLCAIALACEKDTPTLGRVLSLIPLLSHFRTPRSLRRDASLEQANPAVGRAAGRWRAIPITGVLEALSGCRPLTS